MNISAFSIRHKVSVLLAVMMLSVFGVIFGSQLQKTLMPDMELPMAVVYCYYNGASPEDMERMLGVTPGSVTVMALKDDKERRVELIIDRDIINGEYIRCHPCINTSTLKIKTEDVLRVFLRHTKHNPRIIDI